MSSIGVSKTWWDLFDWVITLICEPADTPTPRDNARLPVSAQ
jgi:hypothetical protein